MQKAIFVFALFALVALSLADNDQMPDVPKPLGQIIEDHDHSGGKVNSRVARQLPIKLPGMEEMKNFAEEQISKLPQPMQDAIRRAKEQAQKMG